MLLFNYFTTNKYISIAIFYKFKIYNQFLIYNYTFLKTEVSWFIFCKFFEEFLYEVGLKKNIL